MKKSRRNHAPAFKAKVALEAAREESTVTEIRTPHGRPRRAPSRTPFRIQHYDPLIAGPNAR